MYKTDGPLGSCISPPVPPASEGCTTFLELPQEGHLLLLFRVLAERPPARCYRFAAVRISESVLPVGIENL